MNRITLLPRLAESCLLSAAVAEDLTHALAPRPVGEHPLAGFEGTFSCFAL